MGGIVGTPFDLINVRMQFDGHNPSSRNYAHIFQGIERIYTDEGFLRLFRGIKANLIRSILMTVSQLASLIHYSIHLCVSI